MMMLSKSTNLKGIGRQQEKVLNRVVSPGGRIMHWHTIAYD
jgi:hypothetical protein